MSNSSLVTYTKISPNRTSPRNHKIDTISIHCFVGQVTAKSGCNAGAFTKYDPDNGASCNYVVGHDGSIGLCVEEKDRSWCTSSGSNDHRAVTIETASETKDPYKVTAAAYAALLDLVTDICRRNGAKKLLWFGDKAKTLAYTPKSGEMVMTVHRWFAAKACPGDWLYSRHGQIAAEVNKRLEAAKAGKDEEAMDTKQLTSCADTGDNPSAWAKEATDYCKRKGIFAGDGAGNYGWQKPITREATAQIIYNLLEAAGMLDKLPDVK